MVVNHLWFIEAKIAALQPAIAPGDWTRPQQLS
jgi:hypothetical protein